MQTVTKILSNKRLIENIFNDCKSKGIRSWVTGMPTGFFDLDYMTRGLQDGNLILLTGRSFTGKTALALSISRYAALKENKAVAYFTTRSTGKQIMTRLLSMDAEVNVQDLMYGKIDKDGWQKLKESAKRIAGSQLYIDDSPCITLNEIRNKCMTLKKRNNLGLIVIDSLQFILSDLKYKYCSDDKKNQLLMRGLKRIAVEMDCPVVVISKLREPVKLEDNRRPEITDLDSFDYFAQYSDVIIFMYQDRDFRCKLQDKDILTDLIIAKNRSGKDGVVKLRPQFEYSRFINYI